MSQSGFIPSPPPPSVAARDVVLVFRFFSLTIMAITSRFSHMHDGARGGQLNRLEILGHRERGKKGGEERNP